MNFRNLHFKKSPEWRKILIGLLVLAILPITYSGVLIVPNLGSTTPGYPPSQQSQSQLGQGFSNPSFYEQPSNTPPLAYGRRSCVPGYMGTVAPESQAFNRSDADFDRTYRCQVGSNIGLLDPSQRQLPSQQAGTIAGLPSQNENPIQFGYSDPTQTAPPTSLPSKKAGIYSDPVGTGLLR